TLAPVEALGLEGSSGPLYQRVVPVSRGREQQQARGQVAVAPGGRRVVVVLEHGRAELVVVRGVALQEDQAARGIDQRARVAAGLQIRQRLPGRSHPVVARLGEDFLERAWTGIRGRYRLKRIDPLVGSLTPATHRAAE